MSNLEIKKHLEERLSSLKHNYNKIVKQGSFSSRDDHNYEPNMISYLMITFELKIKIEELERVLEYFKSLESGEK